MSQCQCTIRLLSDVLCAGSKFSVGLSFSRCCTQSALIALRRIQIPLLRSFVASGRNLCLPNADVPMTRTFVVLLTYVLLGNVCVMVACCKVMRVRNVLEKLADEASRRAANTSRVSVSSACISSFLSPKSQQPGLHREVLCEFSFSKHYIKRLRGNAARVQFRRNSR